MSTRSKLATLATAVCLTALAVSADAGEITVVATGYEPKPQPAQRGTFREPAGEPRVTRTREPARAARATDVDVPEFIPKF